MISIHAPRVGSDPQAMDWFSRSAAHFNPRSPCGERPESAEYKNIGKSISIHAPRVGSDMLLRIEVF